MAVEKILTPIFRVAFPSVFKKRAYGEGDAKYTITMLFDKSTDLSALRDAAQAALDEAWPNAKTRPKKLANPFLDGDEVEWDGFEGKTFIRATSLYQPGIVDRKRQAITDEEDFYPGCHARATVNAFTYDKKGNRGVSFGLQNLQFIRDDEPFTGRTNAEDDFEDLPEEDGDGAMAPADLGDLG